MMNDLFARRKRRQFGLLLRYWRLVFNDHFIIALFFLFGALAYSYAQWLPQVSPSSWWVAPLVVAWLTVACQFGRLATLVERADPIALLPQTSRAVGYFRAAWYYSFWRGALISLAALVVALPLLLRTQAFSWFHLACWLVLAGLVKALWLLRARQEISFKPPYPGAKWWEPLVCWSLALWQPGLGLTVGLILFLVIRTRVLAQPEIAWRQAVATEEARMESVYRFFNLFTDVPHVQGRVKRRAYQAPLIHWLAKGEGPWKYLYGHGLARNAEVGNLVARLTLVAMVICYFITVPWLNLACLLLFTYLVASQLMPFYRQYDQVAFTHLYPLPNSAKRVAFRRLLNRVLLVAAGLICLASWSLGWANFSWDQRGLNLLAVLVEVWLLNRYYLKVRLKKSEEN